jgi:cytochrome b561
MAPTREGIERYNNVAIALHWLLAALLLIQIYVGWTFGDMPRGPAQQVWFTWHKTLGVTILLLSVLRLVWRLLNPPPRLPDTLPKWERTAARINHVLFYAVLIGLPLTGWATISSGKGALTSTATTLIGGIPWPFIPGLSQTSHDGFATAHEVLIYITFLLIVLHVGAALKHQFIDKARIANRMPPFHVADVRSG